jgi:tol-pal system protein YbgF
MNRIFLAALLSFSFASTAFAQIAPVSEGNAFVPPPSPSMVQGAMDEPDTSVTNPAQLELKLSNIQDELRTMRGKNEELSFQIKKLTESMDKMQRDVEMRLNDLEGNKKPRTATEEKPAAEMAPASATENKYSAENTVSAEEKKPFASTPTTAGDGMLKIPEPSAEATPRDLYNSAFRLLNQTKYDEASKSFEQFTKKYPKDPLIGNAYYWMGETYYIRRDYVTAADNFRAGFEALPTGPKAADNLLKLAMSLNALNRDKEACVVLGQVVSKFKKESVSVTEKAQSEQKRMGCK